MLLGKYFAGGGDVSSFLLNGGWMENETLNGIDKDPWKEPFHWQRSTNKIWGGLWEVKIFGVHPNNHGNETNKAKGI